MVPAPVQAADRSPRSTTTRTWPSSGSATRAGASACSRRARAAASRIDHSEAGLYLWATRGEAVLGHRRPGSPSAASWWRPATFYGAAGAQHVRIALTATDERIAAAVRRLAD